MMRYIQKFNTQITSIKCFNRNVYYFGEKNIPLHLLLSKNQLFSSLILTTLLTTLLSAWEIVFFTTVIDNKLINNLCLISIFGFSFSNASLVILASHYLTALRLHEINFRNNILYFIVILLMVVLLSCSIATSISIPLQGLIKCL